MTKTYAIIAAVIALLALVVWAVSRNNAAVRLKCEKETIVKEVEVIRYVTKEAAKVQSRPDVGRDNMLRLYSQSAL